jgi:hypothetical protein
MCFIFPYNSCSQHFTIQKKFSMSHFKCTRKCRYDVWNCIPVFTTSGNVSRNLVTLPQMKFHKSPLNSSHSVMCEQIIKTGMAKLVVAFFQLFIVNASKQCVTVNCTFGRNISSLSKRNNFLYLTWYNVLSLLGIQLRQTGWEGSNNGKPFH